MFAVGGYLIGRETILKLMESNPTFTEYFLKSHFSRYIHRTYSEMLGRNVLQGGVDLLLFTTTVGELINRPVTTVAVGTTPKGAAGIMSAGRSSSAVVLDDAGVPAGIITDRDLRDRVVATGADLGLPVRSIMSPALIRIDTHDHCFEALLKMVRHNIHHLPNAGIAGYLAASGINSVHELVGTLDAPKKTLQACAC